jgi:hypothetical protein
VVEPASGGWLVMILGALTVVAARRTTKREPVSA